MPPPVPPVPLPCPLCVGLTAVQSVAAALPLPALEKLLAYLPFAGISFGWVLPALVGLALGIALSPRAKQA